MVTQDLLNYIKQQLDLGNTKDSIISNLKSVGWSDNDIQEAFNILNTITATTTTTTNNNNNNNNDDVVNNNSSQVNSTVYSNNNSYSDVLNNELYKTETASKPSMQSRLGLIFSVLSLVILIFNFVSSFFFQQSLVIDQNDPLSSINNNPFLIVLLILGCLVPIFALIGLVLSLLSLKKSKLSIFGLIISLLVFLIQLISFVYGFIIGFTSSFNESINQNDKTQSFTTTPTATTPTTTITSTTTPSPTKTSINTTSISPTPTSYFKTQKEKSDYINKLVEREKLLAGSLPKDYGNGVVLINVLAKDNGMQFIYEVQGRFDDGNYDEMYSDLTKTVCSNKDIFDDILSKDLILEFVYYFKLNSKNVTFTVTKKNCS